MKNLASFLMAMAMVMVITLPGCNYEEIKKAVQKDSEQYSEEMAGGDGVISGLTPAVYYFRSIVNLPEVDCDYVVPRLVYRVYSLGEMQKENIFALDYPEGDRIDDFKVNLMPYGCYECTPMELQAYGMTGEITVEFYYSLLKYDYSSNGDSVFVGEVKVKPEKILL